MYSFCNRMVEYFMSKYPILKDAPHTEILIGNDAFVRGMYEAGVEVAAAYPGSPLQRSE